jgi:FkbM family methyltransferase
MYGVTKVASYASLANPEGNNHHPVFARFPCWRGNVPPDFIVNFLGVLTRTEYFEAYADISRKYPVDRKVETEYPCFDEEYFEWIDILEAVVASQNHFMMLELGAGYGRWTANAAAALKILGKHQYTLVAVEAEPTHFQWMGQHLTDNSVDPGNLRLVQAAVAVVDGKVGFHLESKQYVGPARWYGQYIGGSHSVDAVSLKTLLLPLSSVDLIDIDVQGAELQVLQAAEEGLDEKVKRVHIGTHGADIESGLHSLFSRLGWTCLRSFPCGGSADTEWGTFLFQDGVQTWLNPAFSSPPKDQIAILSAKLAAARCEGARLWQELESLRLERQRVHTIDPASFTWKVLVRAGRFRDLLAPRGTRRRKIIESIAGKS